MTEDGFQFAKSKATVPPPPYWAHEVKVSSASWLKCPMEKCPVGGACWGRGMRATRGQCLPLGGRSRRQALVCVSLCSTSAEHRGRSARSRCLGNVR